MKDCDKEIIYEALVEYEENHYETRNQSWQKRINKLIEEFR